MWGLSHQFWTHPNNLIAFRTSILPTVSLICGHTFVSFAY